MTTLDQPVHFDVVVLADPRPDTTGGNRACQLASALAQAGYRTALLPWLGQDGAGAGLEPTGVRVISAQSSCPARLLIAADLGLFANRAAEPLRLHAGLRVVICPDLHPCRPDKLGECIDHAVEALGGPVKLAPAAPLIRDRIAQYAPAQPMTRDDWPPVVTPAGASIARTARPAQPRLGLLATARDRWPAYIDELQALLPDHPLLAHQVLDCPARLRHGIGYRAAAVTFHDSVDLALPRFLAGIDALAIPGPHACEPWPAEALTALEQGAIPVLDPVLRDTFQMAALYARPKQVADNVIDLHGLPDLAEDLRLAGRALVDGILAPRHAVARVRALIGAPVSQPQLVTARSCDPPGTVLSVSTNGVGMGHLTRQMAIARNLPPDLTPVFIGFSQSIAVVRQFGWVSEYLPYHAGPKLNKAYWNEHLSRALISACAFHRARALVLDANVPFHAFQLLRQARPDLPMIWVRRAMWGPGRDLIALDRAGLFDAVIEPGEIAGAYDTGPTTDARDAVTPVGPIRLLQQDEQLDRRAACAQIGIDPDGLNVLLLPGGMNNFDANALWRAVADTLVQWPGATVVVGKWAITETDFDWPPGFEIRKGFPFSRWFSAFDFAVSAAGYNSFTELVTSGLPTVFVPNENPLMDRQDLRARFAERHGLARVLTVRDRHNAAGVLTQMKSPQTRAQLRAAMAHFADQPDGAQRAARIVAAWARSGRSNRADGWMNAYFEPAPA
ncbi:glycosyltransferase [Actibacterium ureilyticum]|uniref:glycosyltransferase n=1 Tax=Actibacterium ureilyticum TaxID=1590614 RepID=UPI000BAABC46|nr:glycosyltransferase [Actibacterium ureilyticum]